MLVSHDSSLPQKGQHDIPLLISVVDPLPPSSRLSGVSYAQTSDTAPIKSAPPKIESKIRNNPVGSKMKMATRMAGIRILVVLVLVFQVVHGSTVQTSPTGMRGKKLRDPVERPEFSEYELSEYAQSEPPPARRHYNAVDSDSDKSESLPRSTSAPIKIKRKNQHPLLDFDFASHRLHRHRDNAVHNVQNVFKHHQHQRNPVLVDSVRRGSSDFWSEYKRRQSSDFLTQRRVATVRGPTPPRRLRRRRPEVTYQIYLTPSESSSTSSGEEYWRRPRTYSSVECSEEDQSQKGRSTEVDLIFELSIDQTM